MRKTVAKITGLLLTAILMLSLPAAKILANDEATEALMNVTLRIEGIEANLLYKTAEIPYNGVLTVSDALLYIDAQEESVSISGIETGFISDINGEATGVYGGWDGWMYMVNGEQPELGIGSYELADGDVIVVYYGDPYGVGMQYPVADISEISEGIIKFTSEDVTFDDEYNKTVTVNPVVSAEVVWRYGSTSALYTTDENGEIRIKADQLDKGEHIIQISKADETGLPIVLRFAPDYAVYVAPKTDTPDKTLDDLTDNVGNSEHNEDNEDSEDNEGNGSIENIENNENMGSNESDQASAADTVGVIDDAVKGNPATGQGKGAELQITLFAAIALVAVAITTRKKNEQKRGK